MFLNLQFENTSSKFELFFLRHTKSKKCISGALHWLHRIGKDVAILLANLRLEGEASIKVENVPI